MIHRNFAPFPILTTQRLTLRQVESHDQQTIFSLRADVDHNRYLGRPIAGNIDDARNFINKVNECVRKSECLYWGITLSDKNVLVGTIGLFSFSDETDKCEIGFELMKEFQGQGIMVEAVAKVINYAFNNIKVQEIEAFSHRNNLRSIMLLEKFLFQKVDDPGNTEPNEVAYHLMNVK
jgi:ribosomal-protein-alanine N-acetyltransferase